MQTPKNTFLANGHNAQGARRDLPLYLPGNGGLLIAVAAMAAGWDGLRRGGPGARFGLPDAPGFPSDGTWEVAWGGLLPLP